MNRRKKLIICDASLLAVAVITIASGILLEITDCASAPWVWTHTAAGGTMAAILIWHLHIHFGWKGWRKLLLGSRRKNIRWLSVFSILTAASGLIATAHRIAADAHSAVGGIHGKIGYVFAALCIFHIVVHRATARCQLQPRQPAVNRHHK